MAINVYNTKQQALNAEKLAELFSFSTNDFGGLVSSDLPIAFSKDANNKWMWSWVGEEGDTFKFIGGGIDIDYIKEPNEVGRTLENNYFYALHVTVPDPSASITTDKYSVNNAIITQFSCTDIIQSDIYLPVIIPTGNPKYDGYYEYVLQYIEVQNPEGNPSEQGWYEYDELNDDYIVSQDTQVDLEKTYYINEYIYIRSNDEEVDNEKVYYTKAPECIVVLKNVDVNGTGTYRDIEYYGNTCWVSNNSFIIPICGWNTSYETPIVLVFNRNKTGYESFLTARTYYHILKQLEDIFVFRAGGPTKGDIGQLNITNNIISNKDESNVSIDSPKLLNIDNSVVNEISRNILLTDDDGNVMKSSPQYIIPVQHGGTSSNNRSQARKNLGIYYGKGTPENVVGVPKKFDGSVDTGAVYFKIL